MSPRGDKVLASERWKLLNRHTYRVVGESVTSLCLSKFIINLFCMSNACIIYAGALLNPVRILMAWIVRECIVYSAVQLGSILSAVAVCYWESVCFDVGLCCTALNSPLFT